MRRACPLFLAMGVLATGSLATAPAHAVDRPPRTPGAVISAQGFALKCVTRHSVQLLQAPSPTAAPVEGGRLRPWTFLFVLPPDANTPADRRHIDDLKGRITTDGFYRVSASPYEADERGYVFASETVLWGHRQAVVRTRAAQDAGKEVTWFKTASAAMRALKGDVVDPAQQVARESNTPNALHAFFPVISQSTRLVDGGVREPVYQLMFFGRRSARQARQRSAFAQGPTREQIREVMANSRMEIAFVIDTTGSMHVAIQAVRASIASVAEYLRDEPLLSGRVRIGLVGYRDRLTGLRNADVGNYTVRLFSDLTTDFVAVQGELHRMDAKRGGQDRAEDGLLGLETAFDQLAWTPHAWKHIVLVTDASIKAAGHLTSQHTLAERLHSIHDARERARDTRALSAVDTEVPPLPWVLSVIQVPPAKGTQDVAIAREQYERLAGIHPRADDRRTMGFHLEPGSASFSLELIDVLRGSFKHLAQIVGGDRSRPASPGDANQLAQIPWGYLELLESDLEDEQIHTGFVTQHDAMDRKLFEEVILIRKAELVSLHTLLEVLMEDVRLGPTLGEGPDIQRILTGLQSVAAGTYSGEAIAQDTPLERVAAQIASIPLQTDALALTPRDLQRMPAADRAQWIAKVQQSIGRIVRTLEGTWHALSGDEDAENVYTFVPLRALP